MKIKVVTMHICEACLDGVGQECHTPGCAMWLHTVDLPFPPGSYEVQREYEDTPAAPPDISLLRVTTFNEGSG